MPPLTATLVTAAILTILFASLLGSFLFKGVYGPLQRKKSSNVILLIASVGLLILIENMLLLIVGSDIRLVKYISLQKGISFFGAFISPSQLVILATTLIIFISLGVFLNKSRLGRKLRAVSDNRNLAKTSGIHTERIQLISFLMGSALAGIAGILISLEQAIEPTLGTSFAIKGFIGSIIGGIGSIPGALLGSYFLGLVENFGTWYLPSAYKEGIAFLLLLIFLLWKPNGFLGVKKQ